MRKSKFNESQIVGILKDAEAGVPVNGTSEYFNPTQKRMPKRLVGLGVEPDELRAMDLEDALIFIAERNNGVVTNGTVRPILVEAGVFHSKQISHKLSSALKTSFRFEKEKTGRYRLIDLDIPF